MRSEKTEDRSMNFKAKGKMQKLKAWQEPYPASGIRYPASGIRYLLITCRVLNKPGNNQ
jgi:hypothetical protein